VEDGDSKFIFDFNPLICYNYMVRGLGCNIREIVNISASGKNKNGEMKPDCHPLPL
jgi:hypothetical protein